MGMGYGANYADVIDDEFVKKTCPKELAKLEKAIDDEELDFEAFAMEAQWGDMPSDEIEEAYVALQEAFEKKTDLTLGIGFHDQHDEGDRYDQVNGAFWHVGGAYQMTPAGEKYKKHINRLLYVSFG